MYDSKINFATPFIGKTVFIYKTTAANSLQQLHTVLRELISIVDYINR